MSSDSEYVEGPGPEVIKLFSCSVYNYQEIQLFKPTVLFFLLINVGLPTIVAILHFNIYEQKKFHAQMS